MDLRDRELAGDWSLYRVAVEVALDFTAIVVPLAQHHPLDREKPVTVDLFLADVGMA